MSSGANSFIDHHIQLGMKWLCVHQISHLDHFILKYDMLCQFVLVLLGNQSHCQKRLLAIRRQLLRIGSRKKNGYGFRRQHLNLCYHHQWQMVLKVLSNMDTQLGLSSNPKSCTWIGLLAPAWIPGSMPSVQMMLFITTCLVVKLLLMVPLSVPKTGNVLVTVILNVLEESCLEPDWTHSKWPHRHAPDLTLIPWLILIYIRSNVWTSSMLKISLRHWCTRLRMQWSTDLLSGLTSDECLWQLWWIQAFTYQSQKGKWRTPSP